MGGRSAVPKRNKKLERMQMKLMAQQLKNAKKKIHAPSISLPPPIPVAPGAQASTGDAAASSQQQRRLSAARQGNTASVLSGETGGYLGGGQSLLG